MDKETNTTQKRRTYFPIVVALFLFGALAAAFSHFNDGNKFSYLETLYDILCSGALAIAIGLGARALYILIIEQQDNKPHILTFIIALVVIAFGALFFAKNTSGIKHDSGCTFCNRPSGTSHVEISNDSICPNCLSEKLISCEIGFCESCHNAYETEDMIDGYCENCFDEFAAEGYEKGYEQGFDDGYNSCFNGN